MKKILLQIIKDMLIKILKDCFTEKDNQTWDIVRILGAFSYLMIILIAFIHAKSCQSFNFVELSTGLSMLLAVIAAGITLKSKKENKNPDK